MLTFPHRWTIPVWVLIIGFAYGAVDELLQTVVGRSADFRDWVADALGVWAGVSVLWLLRKLPAVRRAMSALPATS
jgi:VanZ family protein